MRHFRQAAVVAILVVAVSACSSTATDSDRQLTETTAIATEDARPPAEISSVPSAEATIGPEASAIDPSELPGWTLDDTQIADLDLPIGTCVPSVLVEERQSIQVVACDEIHGAEIFHRQDVKPGQYLTYESAEHRCEEVLRPLVEPYGLTREPSGSTVVAIQSSDRWSFVCTIGSGFTGSFVEGTVADLDGVAYGTSGTAVQSCASDCSRSAVVNLELQVSHVRALDDGRAVAIGIDGAGWIWGTGISDEPVSLEPLTTYSYDFQGTFDSVPDGRVLLGSYDGGSYLWNLVTGESEFLPYEAEGELGPYAQVAMPDGRLLFEGISSWVSFDLRALEEGAQPLPDATPLGTIDAVALGDGNVFAATYGGLFVWDPSGTSVPTQIPNGVQDPFRPNAVAGDGDQLVVVAGDSGLVLAIDLVSGTQTRLLGLDGHVDTARVLVNGQIAAGDWSGTIAIWDIANPADPSRLLNGHEAEITSLAQLPDGRLLSASNDATVRTWVLD